MELNSSRGRGRSRRPGGAGGPAGRRSDGRQAPAQPAPLDRLAAEVRWLPCAPTCSNWLRYGVQPKGAQAGMVPGHCTGKAHDRANLGLGGRRELVSRKWSGETLAGHKADRAAVVRAALEEAGIDPDDHDELAVTGNDERWSWEVLPRSRVDERTYAAAIVGAITTRQRWRHEYEAARARRMDDGALGNLVYVRGACGPAVSVGEQAPSRQGTDRDGEPANRRPYTEPDDEDQGRGDHGHEGPVAPGPQPIRHRSDPLTPHSVERTSAVYPARGWNGRHEGRSSAITMEEP